MNFTGSSIEYMMQQNRAAVEKRGSSRDALPPTLPCYGCSYAKERCCIGYCMKKLMSKGGEER